MIIDSFERDEDIFRSVILEIDDAVVDTSTFTTIRVKVRHKYSKVEIGDYTAAAGTVKTPAPTSSGIITFIVARTENEDAAVGLYEYEIETTEADADYSGGVRHRKFVGDCFILNYADIS